MTQRRWIWQTAFLLGISACTHPAPPRQPDGAPTLITTSPAPTTVGTSEVDVPTQVADQMDPRTPVPLLPMMAIHQKQNMREHLVAVQEIVVALGTDDFEAIAKAAGRVGYSEQMGTMCAHMGAGAPGFTPAALHFHHTADTIGDAARAHDHRRVIAALGATLATCTGCHATYKQRIVDEANWR